MYIFHFHSWNTISPSRHVHWHSSCAATTHAPLQPMRPHSLAPPQSPSTALRHPFPPLTATITAARMPQPPPTSRSLSQPMAPLSTLPQPISTTGPPIPPSTTTTVLTFNPGPHHFISPWTTITLLPTPTPSSTAFAFAFNITTLFFSFNCHHSPATSHFLQISSLESKKMKRVWHFYCLIWCF